MHNKCSLGDAIFSSERLGFDVLAANKPMPKAADELSETWLDPMLATLKKFYDVVLIDVPPVLAVSDALVLSQVVDTSVYLVKWDTTPRSAVLKGLGQFAEMGTDPAGVVLTMVDPARKSTVYSEEYAYHA